MLISRSANLLRTIHRYKQVKNVAGNVEQIRLGHGVGAYRKCTENERGYEIAGQITMGFAWWWVLWHIWHHYEHIIGEYEYPDPSKWTDEELGIPPDNE